MVTMLTAHTFELDDIEAAVSEIVSQLDLENKQRKYSAGILSCYPEFLETGVVKAVCDRMPFDIVGCTTLGCGTPGAHGLMMLSLSVLTSDEVVFATALSSPLVDGHMKAMEDAYACASAALPDNPSMMIPMVPLVSGLSNDVVIDALDAISGGLPIFGTLPSDDTSDYSQSFVLYNGESFAGSMAMLLLSGPITPQFFIVSIPDGKRQKQEALITSSEGCIVHEVNGMPIVEYLQTIGLCKATDLDVVKIVPFIVDFNDGTTPVARGIYRFTPEGSAVCGGHMPLNATLAIGSLESEDVVSSTRKMIETVLADKNITSLLAFSCLCRGWALGVDALAELNAVGKAAKDVPHLMLYSGGELCPVYDEQGKTCNRFHNYTCILCAF